ncbi:spermidine/putrescine ABC transporter ATP-binding protein PotA [Vibrio sp. CAIM 722]|uniref:Spermidine/putrescine import ATP-binding protein PotA n=1 Tax=Vibrio eleionomae TaxID=2653505 RepID=A0A7X4LJN4_9VIBR|nr:spermidine/putrescine ABC transporter ATP-binding protein PotA [Vibrio eleionomae]
MGEKQKLNKQHSVEQPVVRLTGVSKSFDGKEIISNLHLDVNHGEFLTILGPSGCGKTTVLRMIAGFENVDSGQVILDSHDVTHTPAEQRYVNTVFQSYALFPHMTVFDNVAFGLRMQKVPAADIQPRVLEALKMVRLEEMAQRKPSQLSGGQQQRVAIARAVVNKPKVLLLDESLSALDYKLRKQMQGELKRLQRRLGITFIFVTHDQEEALSMSDRIIVMRDGVVEQDGSPREIYEEPKNLFVARFIGEINVFPAVAKSRIDDKRILVDINGVESTVYHKETIAQAQKLQVLLRPEDLRLEEISDAENEGIIGYVRDRTYKGMTLESLIELDSGDTVMVSEFFNEDDPDVDHKIGQKVAITWVESWEVVLDDQSQI